MLIYIFYGWLLLLPFSWIIFSYTGLLALDKALAPLLLILAPLLLLQRGNKYRLNQIILFSLLLGLLVFIKNISFINHTEIFFSFIWADLIRAGYFLVPYIYISNLQQFRVAGWIVVFLGVAGCISTLLVAFGFLNLPIQRFEVSRIGIENIQKSIGIFPSYGDLAQYISFAMIWVLVIPGEFKKRKFRIKLITLAVFLAFVLGLIGGQSRNILLSGLFALIVLWAQQKLYSTPPDKRPTLILLYSIFLFVSFSLTLILAPIVIDALSNMAGGLASQTAEGRLNQYAYGWSIIKASPIFGADLAEYTKSGGLFTHIHNMWIKTAAQGGLLTALLLAFILWKIYSSIRFAAYIRQKRAEATVLTSYFMALLLSTMFYGGLNEVCWALLGIAASLANCPPLYQPVKRATYTRVTAHDPTLLK